MIFHIFALIEIYALLVDALNRDKKILKCQVSHLMYSCTVTKSKDNHWEGNEFYFIYFVSRFDGTSDWLFQVPRGIAQTAYKQIE